VLPQTLFLLSFYIVNFSILFLDFFDSIAFKLILEGRADENVINYSYYLAFLGMLAFYKAGYIEPKEVLNPSIRTNSDYIASNEIRIFKIGSFFLIPLLFFLIALKPNYWLYYEGVFARQGLFGFIFYTCTLLGILIGAAVGSLIQNGGSIRGVKFKLILLPWTLLVSLFFLSGDRGEAVLIISGFIWPFLSRNIAGRFTALKLLLMIIVGITLFGILREIRGNEIENTSDFFNYVSVNGLLIFLIIGATNAASSGLLLPSAISYVGINGYTNGALTLTAIMGIVPGLRGILKDFEIFNDFFIESATILTIQELGHHSTSGMGTTTLADFYIDFGLVGIVTGHFILGWIAKKISYGIFNNHKASNSIFFCCSLGLFTILPRYSAFPILIKYFVFTYAVYLFLNYLTKKV
jgi:hypothetical protein